MPVTVNVTLPGTIGGPAWTTQEEVEPVVQEVEPETSVHSPLTEAPSMGLWAESWT